MRTLYVAEFISLDGVIDSPGGEAGYPHAGWTFDIDMDEDVYTYKGEELAEAEALLLGRLTYEGFAAAWPDREDDSPQGDFARKFNSMPKYVASTTLTDPAWNNTTVLEGDVVEAVRKLKEGDGGPIMVNGSASLVQTLHKAGLVDEYRLQVWPVILGSGKRLFPDDAEDKQKLELVRTHTYSNGIQLQILRVVR
jgi:dihydrofolate reductase